MCGLIGAACSVAASVYVIHKVHKLPLSKLQFWPICLNLFLIFVSSGCLTCYCLFHWIASLSEMSWSARIIFVNWTLAGAYLQSIVTSNFSVQYLVAATNLLAAKRGKV